MTFKPTSNRGWKSACLMWSVGLVAVGGLSTRAQTAAQATPRGEVTFTRDIAPILQRSCENCHRRNGVAPMPLSTYEEVRPWARSIKVKTSLREMPPWYIEKYIGIQKFKNDPSLSDEEIATVATWVDRGAPRGNPADMPPPRQYQDTEGWNIGTPDLVVSSPVITVKAVAPDYNNEVGPSPTGLTEDRYIKAIEVKETRLDAAFQRRVAGRTEGDLNYFTLHHAGIQSPGFGMDEDRNGFNFVYNLGAGPTFYPDNTGVVLKAGTELSFRLHMHSVGREMTVRVDVGFKFHPKGFKPKYFQPGGYFANLGNSAKDKQRDALDRNAEISRDHTVPEFVQDDAGKKQQAGQCRQSPMDPRAVGREHLRIESRGQQPEHEHERHKPREMDPNGDAKQPADLDRSAHRATVLQVQCIAARGRRAVGTRTGCVLDRLTRRCYITTAICNTT